MKNKLFFLLFAVQVISMTIFGCGGGGSGSGSVSAQFTPSNGATNVALNANMSVVFSEDITAPSDWSNYLTLKDSGGTSLTITVNYDSASRTGTITHDELSGDTTYTLAIAGLSGVENGSASFTTGSAIALTMNRSSVTSASAGNNVELDFTYASAVPTGWTPDVTVTDAGGTALTVNNCSFSAGRTEYSCTVEGIAGCTTFSDYFVTVMGTGEFTTSFNSADDEFDSDSTLNACWQSIFSSASATISGGELTVTADNGDSGKYAKDISGTSNIAYLGYVESVVRPLEAGLGAQFDLFLQNQAGDNASSFSASSYNGGISSGLYIFGSNMARFYGDEIGSLSSSDGPFYICRVLYDNTIKSYISSDGSTYTPITTDNMSCGVGGCDLAAVVQPSSVDWATDFSIYTINHIPSSTITSKMGYVRFKTMGLTGTSSADCPSF